MSGDVRDHGYGDNPKVTGTPKVIEVADHAVCPNCECRTVMTIEVEVENDMLVGSSKGIGTYMGCPACPWASQMMTRAI